MHTSITPEDKFGPAGYDDAEVEPGDEERFILPGQMMEYRIDFWNHEDAEVPTQDAVIYDLLDPEVFDVSTFEFTRIGFLDWDMPLPLDQVIDTRIDCRPEMNIAVDVRGGWEMEVFGLEDPTGKLVWWFHTVDPETGDYSDDPMAGFLPPFDPETEYELGWVEFRVQAWDDLPTGTRIENQAFVQFDFTKNPMTDEWWGPAPPDGPWVNTIDAGPPESWVEPLPAVVNTPEFLVTWDGQDDTSGSGIAHYDIYVSTDDGPFSPWLAGTTDTSALFSGEPGLSYAFFCVATDNVGHREAVPETYDTVAYVNFPPVIGGLTTESDLLAGGTRLTATDVSDQDGFVVLVEFWHEDVLLGSCEDDSDGWRLNADTRSWEPGEYTFRARAQDNDGAWSEWVTATATVASWTNPENPFDVNADGAVSPLDVLAIINRINFHGDGPLPPRTWDNLDQPYFDVTEDRHAIARDVLRVINYLNYGQTGDPGEGGQGEAVDGGIVSEPWLTLTPQTLGRRRLTSPMPLR